MSSILLNKAFSQQNRLLRLHTPLGENVFIAEYLDGWEALDQGGYCLELSVLSSDGRLPLEQLVGAQVLLQMQCADSRSELRPFHGHVSHYTRVGSNGGLARYQLRIEPWLGLLRYRQDSYAFHDMSVVQICDQIFGFYHRGVIHPHWRWELEDRGRYRQRSLTTQYQETDFDFVQRLLAEEGIAYRFEHQGDPRSPSLGCHTLVLSDSNFRLAPQAPASVPFQRSDVTANEDGIQQWEEEHHWVVSRVTRQSWDYRSHQCLSARADSHDGIKGCEDHDSVGLYAWNTWAQGERLAHQHLDALHVTRQQVHSRGTWRRLAPGSRL
ncbi:type VI secretion system Vgr family protein, partial [Pseudomonas agarici]|uniref:type VI secretion system Vgr family protein n=2 Tax=Pseudomonas agarici TaxID=46677 RepID=UPI00037785FC